MDSPLNSAEVIAYKTLSLDAMPEDIRVVYDYWDKLRGDRFAPAWPEIDMTQIPSHLLPSTLVKDVLDPPTNFRYRFYGSRFVTIWDKEMTGKTVADLDSEPFAQAIRDALIDITKTRKPVFSLLEVSSETKATQLQVQLRLPLSDGGENVGHILTVVLHVASKEQYHKMIGEEGPCLNP